jgi:hypothetical protein
MRAGCFGWMTGMHCAAPAKEPDRTRTGGRSADDQRHHSYAPVRRSLARLPVGLWPYTTIYNRFNRWSKRGRWGAIFKALANCGKHSVTLSIDSTSIKTHSLC